MNEFKQLLRGVDRSYDDFVRGVVSYIKIPGNEHKKELIEEYILSHPDANSSDVLEYMINETGFFESINNPNLEVVA